MSTPELFRALAVVCEDATPAHVRVRRSGGAPARDTPPSTPIPSSSSCRPTPRSIWGPKGCSAGRRATGWPASGGPVGLTPPAEPDHLAALLGLYAALAENGEMGHARQALLYEHLLPWVPAYLTKLTASAPASYAGWGRLLDDTLRAEAAAGLPDTELPLHLREAPPPVALEAGLDDVLGGLLAPARSGMVIARSDLVAAARALGLGLRQGERRYALRALLNQDAPATLGWLAGLAEAWAGEHERSEPWLGAIAGFWRSRAEITALRLHEAAEVAAATAGEALAAAPG